MKYLTTAAQRKGLLVAIISGGRPTLAERKTARWLDTMKLFKPAGIVWVVDRKDEPTYQTDEHEICWYEHDWALEYAKAHWTDVQLKPEEAKALGGFPGREWACLEAERRGCWGVLQLDDNICDLRMPRGAASGARIARQHGALGMYADFLSAMALSTNGRMVGANLNSVAQDRPVLIRQGFPYSLFVEKVGAGRENWHGPFEDDIIQAFQYQAQGGNATTAVMPALRYMKDSSTKGGLRTIYDHTRSVQLARMFPENAKVMIKKSFSNGKGTPRVFHKMSTTALKKPIIVTDRRLFNRAKRKMEDLVTEWHAAHMAATEEKIRKRVEAGA